MENTYLYFAKAAGTENLLNQSSQDIQLTTSLTDPVPPGTDAPAKGVFKVEVLSVTAGMAFGSAYGSPAVGSRVTLNIADFTYHSTNGTLTIPNATADTVNGFTKSSTASENDYVITMLKPIDPDDVKLYPASNLRGIQMKDSNETHLYFDALTGDANDVDTVTIQHGANQYKNFAKMVNDAVTDPRNQGKVVVFADDFNEIYYDTNPAGITAVAFTLDT
tara:strand:- start:49 stop:708 length:660 start_codon:yes stop_codon:yes gene_type:complete